MSEKEYIVTLKAGVDYDAFNTEMVASTGAGDIPNRTVDVANAYHHNGYIFVYFLKSM